MFAVHSTLGEFETATVSVMDLWLRKISDDYRDAILFQNVFRPR